VRRARRLTAKLGMARLSGVRLAELLAERLRGAFPEPFVAVAENGVVRVGALSSAWFAESHVARLLDDHEEENEGLTTACLAALSLAQDFLSEALTVPWPGAGRTGPGSDTVPYAVANAEGVVIGYRNNEGAILELGAVRIDELLAAG
jgi:hypothetical protein